AGIPVAVIGRVPTAVAARAVGEGDCDVLVDLGGFSASTGALMASHPARMKTTLGGFGQANGAPLVDATPAAPDPGGPGALASHRQAIESALVARLAAEPAFRLRSTLTPGETAALWRKAVATH